ncbi:MAG: DUF1501 domain-containing protein [Lentisphaeria bacterium]|nr:DUF1501 domain-containing protein [Lentisphaeria bacterium]
MKLPNTDELSRRNFIKSLALSTFGLSVGMNPLWGDEAPPEMAGGMAQAVIYIYLSGGISHVDSFDPKSNAEVMGETEILTSKVDNMTFGNNFVELAKEAESLALIRSLSTNQGAHEEGNYFMHTSYRKRATIQHPSLGAWVHKMSGKHHPSLPPSVHIGGGASAGRGFFPSVYQPLVVGNPNDGLANSKIRHTNSTEFAQRRKLAQAFDEDFHKVHKSKSMDAYVDVYEAALKLMKSRDLQAFNLGAEPGNVRAAYGGGFGQGLMLARRLVEHGVRFVEVQMGGWDTHADHFDRFESQATLLDRTLATLLRDLKSRGLLESTLVVVATEFGRTPTINGNSGRDHYPRAFSGLMAGGGIKGGTVYGKTDKRGENVIENKVDVTDFNATIAHALGIDPTKVTYSSTGRPFRIANKGVPIKALFS